MLVLVLSRNEDQSLTSSAFCAVSWGALRLFADSSSCSDTSQFRSTSPPRTRRADQKALRPSKCNVPVLWPPPTVTPPSPRARFERNCAWCSPPSYPTETSDTEGGKAQRTGYDARVVRATAAAGLRDIKWKLVGYTRRAAIVYIGMTGNLWQ